MKWPLHPYFFSFCCAAIICRPPRTWRSEALQSWQVDVDHGSVPRSIWDVAIGDPVYWVTIIILANCATHVLLGWPDGSLVWVLMGLFEKAVSYRLRQRTFEEPRALRTHRGTFDGAPR